MVLHRSLFAAGLWMLATLCSASEAPVTVSPGGAHDFEEVLGRCPTFHWTAAPEAERLELVIYEASAELGGVAESPRVRIYLPPSSQGWTPPLAHCLDAGADFAWSLGVTLADGTSAWSESRFFRVSSVPTAAEVEGALEVLRRYRAGPTPESSSTSNEATPDATASSDSSRAAEVRASSRSQQRASRPRTRLERPRRSALVSDTVGAGRTEQAPILPTSTSLDIEADFDLGRYIFKDGKPFIHTSPVPADQNTAVGLYALNSDTTGSGNTAIGYGAIQVPNGGSDQLTAVGVRALADVSGDRNTAVGYEALMGDTYGTFSADNTAVGWQALRENYAGDRNTAVGSNALSSTDYASGNTAIGFEAQARNFNGYYNTAVGAQALYKNLVGSQNTAMGGFAMWSNFTGSLNTAVGSYALYGNETGGKNVAVGNKALFSNTTIAGPTGDTSGELNTAVGEEAMRDNTVGMRNTAIGEDALRGNTTGNYNTAIGENAMVFSSTGDRNTAVGQDALKYASGSSNTAVGENALFNVTSADGNTAIGKSAGSSITTGYDNILIGESAGANIQTGFDNILIGNFGGLNEFEAQTIRIGAPNQQNIAFMAGIRGVFTPLADAIPVLIDSAGQLVTENSSRRFKTDIRDLGDVSTAIRDLRPVSFRFQRPGNASQDPPQFGLIAEEVAEVLPELVVYDDQGAPEGVFYRYLTPILLKQVQTQQRQIRILQAGLGALLLVWLAWIWRGRARPLLGS